MSISVFANAETALTETQMDGVNAGGFAFADALSDAFGEVATAWTNTVTNVFSTNISPGQFGAIFVIDSDAMAQSTADSDAKATALAEAIGYTQGTLLSDTESVTMTITDTTVALPYSSSYASNTSFGASNIIGLTATANSASSSGATLSN
jgi:hypothetical protein